MSVSSYTMYATHTHYIQSVASKHQLEALRHNLMCVSLGVGLWVCARGGMA
jgi:hypothetical protein